MRCITFEVHGKVQQVHFRKYTQAQATALSLRGWVKNSPKGTVVGEAFGEARALEALAHWLQHTGSPKSRIDRADIRWGEGEHASPEFVVKKEVGGRSTWKKGPVRRHSDVTTTFLV
jgi:acylphosphatase